MSLFTEERDKAFTDAVVNDNWDGVRQRALTAQRGGRHMNEYECDTCAYRCVKIYAEPCTNCMDGGKYEPEEGSEDHE